MRRILVVDDEDVFRELVIDILGQSGYAVLEAKNGEDAIRVARDSVPDLIISDVKMDGLDGFGLLDKLRMDPSTSTIPFIFTTGLSDKESMRKGMTRGADDFLVKPFTESELLSAIEVRLAKHEDMREEGERKLAQLRSSITLALPHEIRTPLTGILGMAEVLADQSVTMSTGDVETSGRVIHESAQRMQRLLENFMIYAQIEVLASDSARLAGFKKCQLPETAALIESLSRTKAESQGRSADLVLDLKDGPIALSDSYLKKILEELLDNAFKFSEAGTKVTVRTSYDTDDVVLSIEDAGRGMTREQIASLGAYVQFGRKFYEQQGTGLGLIIAKRLTELHGGRLECDVRDGRGLAVHVHLPLHSRES